jgi:hypothetical protein
MTVNGGNFRRCFSRVDGVGCVPQPKPRYRPEYQCLCLLLTTNENDESFTSVCADGPLGQ